ncbi:MAG: hypothetical protein HZA52_03700 [Planctomycetes bacterium]|nr:hypothetical protein [Planctomycetota bacterium]
MFDGVGASSYHPPFSALVELTPASGGHFQVGPVGPPQVTSPSLERDPSTGAVYAIIEQRLYAMDEATGEATLIAALNGATDGFCGLAIDRGGSAVLSGVNGPRLYSLDLQTARVTLIGNLGIGPGQFYDLAFRADGSLWGSFVDWAFSAQKSGLYEIDVRELSYVKRVSQSAPYPGIAFMPMPEVTAYCTTKQNSSGCTPSVQVAGVPSVGAKWGFDLTATNLINRVPGQLLYGVRGRDFRPFHGGALCIAPPVQRMPLQSTGGSASSSHDCSGSLAIDVNTFVWLGGGDPLLRVPGTTVDAQWLSRDPGFAPPLDASLTPAIEFVVAP